MSFNNSSRVYGLDIIRAIAILNVVLGHGLQLLPHSSNCLLTSIRSILRFDGVNIFFVLSGYLIGTILIRTLETEGATSKALLNFIYRRWVRTLPPYYLILGFLIFYYFILKVDTWPGIDFIEVRRYVVFMQNFNYRHPSFFPEAWSLAIEEWFYFLVPFTTFVLAKFVKPKSAVLLVVILIILITPLVRYYKSPVVSSISDWDFLLRKQVVTRMDSIVFGLLGAYINYYYHQFWIKWRVTTCVLGICILVITHLTIFEPYFLKTIGQNYNSFYSSVLSFSLASLGVLLILPLFSSLKHGEGLIYRTFTFISLISYSMYLVNLVVVQFIIMPFTMTFLSISEPVLPYFEYILYCFYTISLSYLIYNYFERPIMKMRNRFELFKKS